MRTATATTPDTPASFRPGWTARRSSLDLVSPATPPCHPSGAQRRIFSRVMGLIGSCYLPCAWRDNPGQIASPPDHALRSTEDDNLLSPNRHRYGEVWSRRGRARCYRSDAVEREIRVRS